MKQTLLMKIAVEVGFAAWNEDSLSEPDYAKSAALHKLATDQWRKAARELHKSTDPKAHTHIARCDEAISDHITAATGAMTKTKSDA